MTEELPLSTVLTLMPDALVVAVVTAAAGARGVEATAPAVNFSVARRMLLKFLQDPKQCV